MELRRGEGQQALGSAPLPHRGSCCTSQYYRMIYGYKRRERATWRLYNRGIVVHLGHKFTKRYIFLGGNAGLRRMLNSWNLGLLLNTHFHFSVKCFLERVTELAGVKDRRILGRGQVCVCHGGEVFAGSC